MNDVTPDGQPQLSKHRIEALIDGIFAVAMTLLVIDLRLPEHAHALNNDELLRALGNLVPNFGSWLISFVVLAIFWTGNHRLYSHVRHVDNRLLWLTILMLGGASLLPFASSVDSQSPAVLGQAIYASAMMTIGGATLLLARHIHRHPELCVHPMTTQAYSSLRVRLVGQLLITALTVPLAYFEPGMANCAFLLMFFLRPLSERMARRHATAPAATPAAV